MSAQRKSEGGKSKIGRRQALALQGALATCLVEKHPTLMLIGCSTFSALQTTSMRATKETLVNTGPEKKNGASMFVLKKAHCKGLMFEMPLAPVNALLLTESLC